MFFEVVLNYWIEGGKFQYNTWIILTLLPGLLLTRAHRRQNGGLKMTNCYETWNLLKLELFSNLHQFQGCDI